MRYILMLGLLTVLGTSVFAQLKTKQITDSKMVAACFPKAVIIVPSGRVDPLIIIETSEKFDPGMLIEILCLSNFSTDNEKENFFPSVASNVDKKSQVEVKPNED